MSAPAELADALLAADSAQRESLVRAAQPADLEAAITALGHQHVLAAAEVLTLIEAVVEQRALKKAARRELHRLRSAGIEAAPITAAAATPIVEPSGAPRAEPPVAVSEAWATDIDPTGSRALWLLGERPLGGAWFAALLVNDQQGLLELNVVDTTRKRFLRELEERRRTPGTWVRMPGAYALALVREAVDLGRAAGTPPPPRYRALRDAFGEAPGPPERALIFDTISAVDATFSPELLGDSQALVREPEVTGWALPVPERMRTPALEVARSQSSALLMPGATPAQQALHLLGEVARVSLTADLRRALRRRLEETAFIFASTDRLLAARRAVAAGKALEDANRPIESNPFARVLVEAGLARLLRAERIGNRPAPEVLLELIEGAIEQAREAGRGAVESRPSGLILPR